MEISEGQAREYVRSILSASDALDFGRVDTRDLLAILESLREVDSALWEWVEIQESEEVEV